jgi:predicted enzyme related to lactoylglutathione lyase
MPRVVHFELQATDPEALASFYTDIFDWKFQKWGGPMQYWVIETGPADQPGINGGMLPRNGPVNAVNSINVDSVDAYAAKVVAHGGTIVVPKMTVPGVGYLIYFKDPDGNISGLWQQDPSAK